MKHYQSWVLTDVAHDWWVDEFTIGRDNVGPATPYPWSIRKRTLRGGLRDGVEVIEVHNGALACTLLPTRGMGLWRGDYRGMPVGWRAPGAWASSSTSSSISRSRGVGSVGCPALTNWCAVAGWPGTVRRARTLGPTNPAGPSGCR